MKPEPFSPISAAAVQPRAQSSFYPPVFAAKVEGRLKRQLGNHFGLVKFGVNLTTLQPGSQSALLHRHSRQEELVYVVSGTLTLRTEEREFELVAGDCAGFRPDGPAHHLINRSSEPAVYLEIGDRVADDTASYPEDDLVARAAGAGWNFTRKDGTPW